MESIFQGPDFGRVDLAYLLRAVQNKEKEKLQLVCAEFTSTSVLFFWETLVLPDARVAVLFLSM